MQSLNLQVYLVQPHLIKSITNQAGDRVYQSNPVQVCNDCPAPKAIAEVDKIQFEEIEVEDNVTTATEVILHDSDDSVQKSGQVMIDSSQPMPIIPAPRVIPAANQFIVETFMKDVITRGTGTKAMVLERRDLAGKTGTTNDQMDGWFNGYQRHVVTNVWVGFDTPQPMGRGEVGGRVALPIWIDYMKVALAD